MTPDPNAPYTVEGVVDQYEPWKIVRSENPNRITVSIEVPADQANAILLITKGDGELLASLDKDGTLRVRKIVSDDGLLYHPAP